MNKEVLSEEIRRFDLDAGAVLDSCQYRDLTICACENGIFVRSAVYPGTEDEMHVWSKLELRSAPVGNHIRTVR